MFDGTDNYSQFHCILLQKVSQCIALVCQVDGRIHFVILGR